MGCFKTLRDLKLITVALLKGSRYLMSTGMSVVQVVDSVRGTEYSVLQYAVHMLSDNSTEDFIRRL